MKSRLSTWLLLLIFFVGLGLLLYPAVSDYWNSLHQSRAIANYAAEVAELDDEKYTEEREAAVAYNASLLSRADRYAPSAEERAEYNALLDLTGSGIMGYIEIPSIKVALPIYHGTADSVLQIAIGHIVGTSLPIGGEGTHCVVSGHRGLPSARLFTDLDQLREGDVFMMRVLDETLTYEVDQILIVLPHEISSLAISPGEDLVTLVTCTPYGINSHRLLVRGHRIDNLPEARSVRVTADAVQIDPLIIAPIVAAPMLLILLVCLLVSTRRKK